MTTKKSRSDRGPKHAKDIGATWLKTHDAANAMRGLIKSMGMSAEQKITLVIALTILPGKSKR